MFKIVCRPLAQIRQILFELRTNSKIFGAIGSQIRGRNMSNGYPFADLNGLAAASQKEYSDALRILKEIDSQARKMPRFYGHSFRYLACQDLKRHMTEYLKLAEKCVETRDPRNYLIAVKA